MTSAKGGALTTDFFPSPSKPPFPWAEVRLRLTSEGEDLRKKIERVRAFVVTGRLVLLRHLARRAENLDPLRLVEHYEHVAYALRELPWVARGPYLEERQAVLFFFLDGPSLEWKEGRPP